MQIVSRLIKRNRRRPGRERGAALITTLMMSTLLLTAGGALILTTAMSVTNAYDSTAETQAYYAAEAGMQMTLNVLRGNVAPALTYRDAVTPLTSNAVDDPATTATTPFARLSKWLTYDATFIDRVAITTPYSSLNGSAFNAVLSDPDNSSSVTFSTSGVFPASPGGNKDFLTINASGGSKATITYMAQPSTTLTAYPSVATLLGSFQTSVDGGGATFPVGTTFTLTINQTKPWVATYIINCTLSGTVNNGTSTVDVVFPSLGYDVSNSVFMLAATTHRLNPPNTSSGLKTIPITLTAPEPRRILVRVNGYGPRNSRKQLETMIGRFVLDYDPRSTIAIRSADNGVSTVTFDGGSSNAHTFSGNDNAAGSPNISAFAVTGAQDLPAITGQHGTVTGSPAVQQVSLSNLSSWLQTADQARTTLNKLELAAKSQNRYFTAAAPPASYGTAANPAFTFVDGNCNPGGGSGLVVCTGNVAFDGNNSFNGLVLALGGGVITRDGGGGGVSYGAFAVARFDRNAWGGPFLAPTFNTDGGGNSSIFYDSIWVEKALNAAGRYTLGVNEY